MVTPSSLLPPDEAQRLQTLNDYHILHSLREPLFTEFVELAATLFHVPVALIALVGADEVMYKACHGLPGLQRQPRAEAICALAVRERQAVVFTDLALAGALTTEAAAAARAKGLRFYAGAPLRMPSGHCIGTLCISGQQPRAFGAGEQQILESLAHLAGRFIAVRQHCLADQASDEYWAVVRTELAWEVQALTALVRYLMKYAGTHVPVSPDVLGPVDRRLQELRWRLADYYRGPL